MTEPTSKSRLSTKWGLLLAGVMPVVGCLGARAHTVPTANFTNRANHTPDSRDSDPNVPAFAVQKPTEPADAHATVNAPIQKATVDASTKPLPAELVPNATPRNWRYIVLHHSATELGDVESIDREHRRRVDQSGNPWLGIGYHFVIGNGQGMPDGHIEPTFRWHRQLHGAHAGSSKHNEQGIGICLIGDLDAQPPTARQIAAVGRLLRLLNERFGLSTDDVLAHHELKATACPGRHFPLKEILATLENNSAAVARISPKSTPSDSALR